jgi:hypothetical protein
MGVDVIKLSLMDSDATHASSSLHNIAEVFTNLPSNPQDSASAYQFTGSVFAVMSGNPILLKHSHGLQPVFRRDRDSIGSSTQLVS